MATNTKASVTGVKKVNKHFKEVRVEMKKVHWPTRKEMLVYTYIVLGSIFSVGIFFWILDTGFNALLQLIIR